MSSQQPDPTETRPVPGAGHGPKPSCPFGAEGVPSSSLAVESEIQSTGEDFSRVELQLSGRNHSIPLEALRTTSRRSACTTS